MNLIQAGLIILSGFPILATLLLAYQLMRNGQGALGKPTITPLAFYSGKTLVAIILVLPLLASMKTDLFRSFPLLIQNEIPDVQKLLSLVFLLGGNLLLVSAYYTLSIFTRVGLPTSEHALVTSGVFRISRNPIYTSFFFLFTACFLLIPSLLLALLIISGLVIHHFIILKEEQFLESAFESEYLSYKKNTARYL